MKKGLLTMAGVLLTVSLVSAGTTVPVLAEEETTLVYGSGDYTRINPAMDEHGEINILIFNGLTAHDGDNQVVPGLAESWDFDDETNTYTFHMAEDAKWQDGEPVTAEDVKFTIEAIMDPENGSSSIGKDMGTALITTFYGVILANLIFNPIANNLRTRDEEECLCRQLIVEGVMAIQSGENPKFIREKLEGYLEQNATGGGSEKKKGRGGRGKESE